MTERGDCDMNHGVNGGSEYMQIFWDCVTQRSAPLPLQLESEQACAEAVAWVRDYVDGRLSPLCDIDNQNAKE